MAIIRRAEDNMKFEEIRLIHNWICALMKHNAQYVLFIAKTPGINFEAEQEIQNINRYGINIGTCITNNYNAYINIPLLTINNNIFHLITLHNKEEYATILSTLEVILNE